jgi:hypothetical protein
MFDFLRLVAQASRLWVYLSVVNWSHGQDARATKLKSKIENLKELRTPG